MASEILFTTEAQGYDKKQVDAYIGKLSAAYQAAYSENQSLQEKCKSLLEESKKADLREQTKLNAAVLTKTMINMEAMAQNIISDAQEEVIKAKEESRRVLEEAKAEAAKAREAAQRIRDEANTEAARIVSVAKRNAEQAQEVLERAVRQLYELAAAGAAADELTRAA